MSPRVIVISASSDRCWPTNHQENHMAGRIVRGRLAQCGHVRAIRWISCRSGALTVHVMRKHAFVAVSTQALGLALALSLACGGSQKSDLTATGTPTGEVTQRLEVVVKFSKAMVAEGAVGTPIEKAPLMIAPEVSGEAVWQDPSTLRFVSESRLPPSTGFVATVSAGIKAVDGSELDDDYRFEFTSERLTAAIEIMGAQERAAKDQIIKLSFNQEVAFEQVEKNCHYAAQGKSIPIKLAPDGVPGPAKSYIVAPSQELSLDTEWNLLCKANLRATEGNLGMVAEAAQKFRTYGPLAFISLKPDGDDVVPDEDLQLELAFTNPLAKPYKITLSPKISGFPGRCHTGSDAPPSLSCAAMLDPHTDYTITIDGSQTDIFGQTLGETKSVSFSTTDAEPAVSMESGYFVAELSRSVYPVWMRNASKLDVTAVRVTPATYHQLQPLLDWWDSDSTDFSKTKLEVVKKSFEVAAGKNKWHQHPLDPKDYFKNTSGPGTFFFEVGAPEVERGGFQNGNHKKVLISFTDIGIVSKISGSRGLVWASQLSTGKPLAGAKVEVRTTDGKLTWSGTTDAEGVAMTPGRAKLHGKSAEEIGYESLYIFVRKGEDWSLVNSSKTGGLASWNFNVSSDSSKKPVRLRGFMHTDRGLYRPGETVHIKGLARTTQLGQKLAVPRDKDVNIQIRGPRGNTIAVEEAKLSPFGGFWIDVEVPGDARLGDYSVTAELEHGSFSSRFAVEEYRAATFEVKGKTKTKRIVRRGTLDAGISANYFYGAPLRDGDVEITVHSRPKRVDFREFDEFEFVDERRYDSYYHSSSYSQTLLTEDTTTLDDDGNGALSVSVTPSDISSDADLLVRASVTAPSNEVISKTFTVPYFRSRLYYGIKTPGYFLEVKKPQKFEVVAVGPSGKAMEGKAQVTVRRRDWNCVWEDWGYRGSYSCKEIKHDVFSEKLQLEAGKPTSFEFTPEGGGQYWVIVEGEKSTHAAAAQRLYAWGDGGGSWRSNDSLTYDIIADKKEYRAGDTATLLLQTDLTQGTALVTIERDGVLERTTFEITPTRKHVTIPIKDDYAPNVYASVVLVQGRMGEGVRGKPRMRMGMINLPVRPEANTLKVAVSTDRKDYRPGDKVTATVKVTDKDGKPVSAEVAVTAADEGVLSLIGYKTPNPVPTFYSPWGIGVSTATQYVYLKEIPGPKVERPATGGDGGGNEPGSVRSRFVSTAIWKPGVVTGGNGEAKVVFDAPDNLTAFRVMAVAADKGHRFGSSDKRFTVSKPLQLMRSLPRFLTLGDKLKGGVVVHNETGKAGSAKVQLRSNDTLTLGGASERTVSVPKGGRVPVLFDLDAARVGEAELTFSVVMGPENDAVRFELPVHHPSPERFLQVAAGATTSPANIAIKLPDDAIPSSARVHISVDPDGLSGIEEGLRDLIQYPYGCLEQTTSKVIPMLAVRDLAESLNLDGLQGKALEGFVKAGVAKIGRHQTYNGGFSLWPGGSSEAYYTAYALWGLHLADKAGYSVDESRMEQGLNYLKYDGKTEDDEDPYYHRAGHLGSQAFALHVRAMLGDKDTQLATRLKEDDDLPVFGKAFVAQAMARGLGKKDKAVQELVVELARRASAAVSNGTLIEEPNEDQLGWYMSSSMRTTAIVLDALVELDSKNAVIKPLVALLMKKRRTSRYINTQANLYSLLALSSYARSLSGDPSSVTVALAGNQMISGKLAGDDRMRVASATMPGSDASLEIQPKGEVHYQVTVRYRQKPELLKAVSNGLALEREYLDEDGNAKTSFKVGDVVVVRLTMDLDDSKNHLMISDRMPAGFEALNTRLATVGPVGQRERRRWWGSYRELRDERADFSAEYVWRGKYQREYMVRAIAVGTFALPPSVAELMYEPEQNAQTALNRIEIAPK